MIGHNPKATHADDLQDVVALLKDLPQVSAPANFNASLQARIAAAKAEASEFADVVSLVKELPRVTAPADFDFRLRARIAQAKSEQQIVSAGWWSELFGRTFSWAQAGAAMAAVAIVVSVVTFGVLRSGNEGKAPEAERAQANSTSRTISIPAPSATPLSTSEIKAPEVREMVAGIDANETSRKPIKVVLPPKNPSGSRVVQQPEEAPDSPPTKTELAATRTVIIKHRSGEARVVNLSEYNLGLQTANLRATSSAPKETVAANIF